MVARHHPEQIRAWGWEVGGGVKIRTCAKLRLVNFLSGCGVEDGCERKFSGCLQPNAHVSVRRWVGCHLRGKEKNIVEGSGVAKVRVCQNALL